MNNFHRVSCRNLRQSSLKSGIGKVSNDKEQIVGWYQDPSFVVHGFVYDKGVYTSIDVPGSRSNTEVIGINKQDAIVGRYLDVHGTEHGFLATPTKK
jgi:hypothetical protein